MEIIGRLTADAKVSKLKNEKEVINFSIALNDYYKAKGTKEGVKITTYVNCSYWLSTRVASQLVKGLLVELHGRIGVRAYLNKYGQAKANLTFHVNSIKIHVKPKSVPVETKDDMPF